MKFEPIAIVGQGCVFPGATSPDELWRIIIEGHEALTEPEEGEWRLSGASARRGPGGSEWSIRGGYVKGFASVFDPTGFALSRDAVEPMDRMVHWMLHAAREALRSSGCPDRYDHERTGAVIGNLSLPSVSLSRYAEHVWLKAQEGRIPDALIERAVESPPHPINRFMSGYPAHFLAKAFGLGAGAFCLDAACASSLYAMKLACDRLHDGEADLMLAGAVNGADPLFLHTGFRALKAISPSGQSRPFHPEADGLVPSEGCGFVVLKRLADAVWSGDHILGVIRGIGLSNDGGQGGLLAPAKEGQVRAMRQAYEMAGLSPADISLIECHATGTPLGDAVEIQSMSDVFAGLSGIPIGSIKGNIGHPVTAAGMAGLMKVLRAMSEGVYPATLHVQGPVKLLAGTPFRLVEERERWAEGAPRRAAVSSFGFGGNNAHLIVEQYDPLSAGINIDAGEELRQPDTRKTAPPEPNMKSDLAIVGIGLCAGEAESAEAWAAALFGTGGVGLPGEEAARSLDVSLGLKDISVPPIDLKQALPQQLQLLRAAAQAVRGAGDLSGERTGIFAGIQCDAEIARHIARIRIGDWAAGWAEECGASDPDGVAAALQQAFCGPLEASTVVGLLPNVPANRLNKHLKVAGPGFTISSEQLSGITALELASRALRSGELDAALVGAVELSCEAVQRAAAEAVLEQNLHRPGDASVMLAVKRLEDALRDGNTVYAVLPGGDSNTREADLLLGWGERGAVHLSAVSGHPHAASGLLHVAAGALALHHGLLPRQQSRRARPWLRGGSPRTARVVVHALGDVVGSVYLTEGPGRRTVPAPHDASVPQLHTYAGMDRQDVLQAVRAGRESMEGSARLAIVACGKDDLEAKRAEMIDRLERAGGADMSEAMAASGIFYGERPIEGELAFVFAGAASAYHGMGAELLAAIPELGDAISDRFRTAREAAGWIYEEKPGTYPSPIDKLGAASYLSQLHAEFSRNWLALQPQAAIGLSSGETNALAALGAWRDLDGLLHDLQEHGLYSHELAGDYHVLQSAWNEANPRWENWRVIASAAEVRKAILTEGRVRLTLINAPEDCVIGGDPAACRRVLERLKPALVYPLGYDMVVHSPELSGIAPLWRAIHRRPTRSVPGIRFYSGVTGEHYEPDADRAADVLLEMAGNTVDFPRVIQRAWEDGVRLFVEHGPRGLCSTWIDQILGEREHLCVALDVNGVSALDQAVMAAGRLFAAGVEVDVSRLKERIAGLAAKRTASGEAAGMTFPAHLPPVVLPKLHARTPDAGHPNRQEEVKPLNNIEQTMHTGGGLPRALAEQALSASAALARQYAVIANAHIEYLEMQTLMQQRLMQMLEETRERLLQARPTSQAVSFEAATVTPPSAPQSGASAWAAVVQASPQEAPRQTAPTATFPSTIAPTAASASTTASTGASASTIAPAPIIRFSREELERLASGRISEVFGPAFAEQDRYARQVRMPEPPLLLADRVVGVEGEPLSMGLGSIRTETDVRPDSWYLHKGRMPFGIMVEAGQADLLLISWLGIDRFNQGQRVYRLLGCELTFHGSLPAPGETLSYEIRVDSHARQGEIRLFFFQYDCIDKTGRRRMTMRQGQAGFFTDEELRESGGVIWDPQTAICRRDGRLDPPLIRSRKSRFGKEAVRAFADGHLYGCFGDGFEYAQTHTRSPAIQSGRMLLLDEVTAFHAEGGPWGRGYLRAETALSGDEWFFAGHFKNDPAMPGTLMLEGCVQAMSFYLAGLGYTLRKDGWRFEPVPDLPYRMVCRGQVTPLSRTLVYEVFVQEAADGPEPMLIADVLLTVDGLKAFHCSRLAVRLVSDFPLHTDVRLLAGVSADDPRATSADGIKFDYYSLLACAFGKPSHAFGSRYAAYDGGKHVPRLPGPPYHFMTRVTEAGGPIGVPKIGTVIETEYDIPQDAWYFSENGSRTMPFCVLLEAALQPCGWLTSYLGIPESPEEDAYFRNLDGKATLHREIGPESGTLRTRVALTSLSRMGHTYIEAFQVECFLQHEPEEPVFTMSTVFGHFTLADLSNQVGLGASAEEVERMRGSSAFEIDLRERPAFFFNRQARLAQGKLLMLDRVTGYWKQGGRYGNGRSRAEKRVDAADWFFKAHFFQDPVQPGSLGVEAMLQLLQIHMLQEHMDDGMFRPRFEPLRTKTEIVWKYRGQVTPANHIIVVDLDILETGRDERGAFALAEASLWVDGLQIYHVPRMGMRLVEGEANPETSDRLSNGGTSVKEIRFSPDEQPWIRDHCPTYTAPAMPSTFMLERMAAAVQEEEPFLRIVGVSNVQIKRWLVCDRPRRLRTEVRRADGAAGTALYDAVLLVWREASDARLSRFEEAAAGRFELRADYPAAGEAEPAPLVNPSRAENPYDSGRLFHGPAFHITRELIVGANGATSILGAEVGGAIAAGCLHPLLLDGATHAIPHDELSLWSPAISAETVGYPHRITQCRFYGPAPVVGAVRCEVRFDGFAGGERYPAFRIHLFAHDGLWASLHLVEVLLPKGRISQGDGRSRKAFLQDGVYVKEMGVSRYENGSTALTEAEVRSSDWFTGTVATVYGLKDSIGYGELTRQVAVKDHVARLREVHPATVVPDSGFQSAVSTVYPFERWPIRVEERDGETRVSSGDPVSNIQPVMAHWRGKLGKEGWLGEDLYRGLIGTFVGKFVVSDPIRFEKAKRGPILYLANHQTAVESLLFSCLAEALTGRPVPAVAKKEHRDSWIGRLMSYIGKYPGMEFPPPMVFFDREDQASMLKSVEELSDRLLAGQESLLVHVEGTRALSGMHEVAVMSAVWPDLALKANIPIVPVRFIGGLPAGGTHTRLEFPVGYGNQDYWIGRPIFPEELRDLPYADRKRMILNAINETGRMSDRNLTGAGDPDFAEEIHGLTEALKIPTEQAVLLAALRREDGCTSETAAILQGLSDGRLRLPDDPNGRWLADIARWLYGPAGPKVHVTKRRKQTHVDNH